MSTDMPSLPDRDDPMTNHVEYVGPFQRTYLVVNGFKVPRMTIGSGTGDTVEFILDERWSYDIPKAVAEDVALLVANAVAIERGYPCFPRSPDDWRMEPTAPFGPVISGMDEADRA